MGFVQVGTNTGTSGTSLTVTLGTATTAGNCLIVCFGGNDFTTPPGVSGITLGGSAGNFGRANRQNAGGNNNVEIWVDYNCAGGQTSVVLTLTGDAGGDPSTAAYVFEWSGVLTTNPLDKAPAGASGTASPFTSNSTGVLSQANEVAFGIAGNYNGGVTLTGPASPWTNEAQLTSGIIGIIAGYQQVSATTALTYSGTVSGVVAWEACIVTLELASGGGGVSGTQQPLATVPVPRRRPARGVSHGASGQAYVAVPAPAQEYRTLPRRKPARGVSRGAAGQAYVAVPAPPQHPYLPPRRRPARAVIGFTPVTTTNAPPVVPVSGTVPPYVLPPRRKPARGQSHGGQGQAYVAVPAPPQPPPGPRRPGPRRATSRGASGQAYVAVAAPPQRPYLPPRRKLARAAVYFTPVTTTNAIPVAVSAIRQQITVPRRKPARARVYFAPVTTVNQPAPPPRPQHGTPSSDDARGFKRWLLWGS